MVERRVLCTTCGAADRRPLVRGRHVLLVHSHFTGRVVRRRTARRRLGRRGSGRGRCGRRRRATQFEWLEQIIELIVAVVALHYVPNRWVRRLDVWLHVCGEPSPLVCGYCATNAALVPHTCRRVVVLRRNRCPRDPRCLSDNADLLVDPTGVIVSQSHRTVEV